MTASSSTYAWLDALSPGCQPVASTSVGFTRDTAVQPDGNGCYRTEIRPGWDIAGNANGGYLLALVLRAMRDASGRPDPVSVTAHYLSPGRPASATIATDVVKQGRSFATLTASLESGRKRVLHALGAFADLRTLSGPELVEALPPDLPPPDKCVAIVPAEPFPPPFMGRVDLRLHPDDAGFSIGQPSGEPRVRGWFRLRDDEPIDTIGLVLATDSFPPTAFNANLPVAWTPTVELTAHQRRASVGHSLRGGMRWLRRMAPEQRSWPSSEWPCSS